jgi:hypothetical protein
MVGGENSSKELLEQRINIESIRNIYMVSCSACSYMNIHEHTSAALGCTGRIALASCKADHVGVSTTVRLDTGHLHPKLEVPRLTCLDRELNSGLRGTAGGKHSRQELFGQRINSYSEHCNVYSQSTYI